MVSMRFRLPVTLLKASSTCDIRARAASSFMWGMSCSLRAIMVSLSARSEVRYSLRFRTSSTR